MNILIAGASGLIGQALVKQTQSHHSITVLGRDKTKLEKYFPNTRSLTWDQLQLDHIAKQHKIINLVGENIGQQRWSEQQKKIIIESRVNATLTLATLCAELKDKSPHLLNASAIGIYGLQHQTCVDETTDLPTNPTDFLSEVGLLWEQALQPAKLNQVTVTQLRFGVVLTKQGGALAKMLPAFQFGLGGPIGSGKQPFCWISIQDAVGAILFLMNNPQLTGAFNLVSPANDSQQQFAQSLAQHLKRPCILPMPAFMVKTLFGQMGEELLLRGQQVNPNRLLASGFEFQHDTLEKALSSVL